MAQPFDLASAFDAACPGVVLTRDMDSALRVASNGASLTSSQILAIVLPLIPEGNPPEYINGTPPAMPVVQPGASPIYAAALPPQPDVLLPIDGNAQLGTVATFAKGLPRFQDSNPDPIDGWSIDLDVDRFPSNA